MILCWAIVKLRECSYERNVEGVKGLWMEAQMMCIFIFKMDRI